MSAAVLTLATGGRAPKRIRHLVGLYGPVEAKLNGRPVVAARQAGQRTIYGGWGIYGNRLNCTLGELNGVQWYPEHRLGLWNVSTVFLDQWVFAHAVMDDFGTLVPVPERGRA